MITFLWTLETLTLFITLLDSISHRKKRQYAYLALNIICIALLLVLVIGPVTWNFIRIYLPPGLLGFLTLEGDLELKLHFCLLPVIFGLMLANLLGKIFIESSLKNSLTKNDKILKPTISAFAFQALVSMSTLNLVLSLVGQGSSILIRATYLQTNGILFLERLTSATSLPLVCILFYLSFQSLNKKERFSTSALLSIYFIMFLGRGSRIAVIMSLLSIFFAIYNTKTRYRKFLLLLIGGYFAVITFEISLVSRSVPHGILNLPKNFIFVLTGNLFDLKALSATFVGTLLSIVVVIPRSIGVTSQRILVSNLNPFLGTSNEALSFNSDGVERLWPYRWVPLSTAGQLYGAIGFAIICIIFTFLGFLYLYAYQNKIESQLGQALRILLTATFSVQFLFYLQYSSRIWFRSAQGFILLSFLLILIRKNVIEPNFRAKNNIILKKNIL